MPRAFADSPEFRRLLDGDPAADLTAIALEIARDAYPALLPELYVGRIEALAARVRERCPAQASVRHILGQINWVLFVEEGYSGNTEAYYDARNSYLNEVMDRRTGIPISLSVLYIAVAGRVGLPMAGVNLPAHFMIRTLPDEAPLFVDPFHGGAIHDRDSCAERIAAITGQAAALTEAQVAPCPSPLVVARILRNLKAIYLRDNEFQTALPVLRRLVALHDDEPGEHRDLGMVCLYAGRSAESLGHLEAYLEAQPHADDADAIRALLRAAHRDVAERN